MCRNEFFIQKMFPDFVTRSKYSFFVFFYLLFVIYWRFKILLTIRLTVTNNMISKQNSTMWKTECTHVDCDNTSGKFNDHEKEGNLGVEKSWKNQLLPITERISVMRWLYLWFFFCFRGMFTHCVVHWIYRIVTKHLNFWAWNIIAAHLWTRID